MKILHIISKPTRILLMKELNYIVILTDVFYLNAIFAMQMKMLDKISFHKRFDLKLCMSS